MKLAKSILYGAAAFGIAAGSAMADEQSSTAGMPDSSLFLIEETCVLADPSSPDEQVAWNDSPTSSDVTYYIYDDVHGTDGRPDRQLLIEQSDTLGYSEIDAASESPIGG